MSLPIPAGTYGIDTMHSQLAFSVKHLGISTIRGSFHTYSGALTVGTDLASTSVTIDADMASVSTGSAMRDGHLHGDDFFSTENHPKLTFNSTAISASGEGYSLVGDLTIRGVTKPVTLAVTFNGSDIFPMDKSTHFGFEATGKISRSDFGVNYGIPMVSDSVSLQLDAQFVQPAAS